MTSLLIFLGCLAAIALVAVTVNRARGIRATYLDAWTFEPGEEVRFDDPGTDFHVVARFGQARVMTFPRMRRGRAILTDRRLLIGARPLASRRHMLTHVVLLAGAVSEDMDRLTGGQFHSGYVTYAARPEGMAAETDGGKAYVRIVPDPTESARPVEHCRLYTDRAAEFVAAASGAGSAA